jgi:hypothetical protein
MQTVVHEDNGTLCLLPEAGQLAIYALSGACNCSRVESSTCTAAMVEGRVVVSSRTAVVTDTEAEVCPTGCETRSAPCRGELPAEGRYDVVHGADRAPVTVPLGAPLKLFGNYPSSSCDDLLENLEANAELVQDGGS